MLHMLIHKLAGFTMKVNIAAFGRELNHQQLRQKQILKLS